MAKIWLEADAALFEASIAALKQYREDRGLTQTQIAAQLGVSARTITRWECGAFHGDRRNADAVGAFLKAQLRPPGRIEVDILFTGTSAAGEQCAQFVLMNVSTEMELRVAVQDHLRVLARTGFVNHGKSEYQIIPGSRFAEIHCDLSEALKALAERKI
jgi:transcriptional regulator with XRE-family HTH domain